MKILQGNPGKKRLPQGEPHPAIGAEIPLYIQNNPALLREWHRQRPRLERNGLLTEIDGDALGAVCVMELTFEEAASNPETSPLVLVKISGELRALWARFGMTPADRARVKTERPAPKSKLEGFRGKASA